MERLKKLPYYGSLALLAYMPFHIFLSQWLSTFTGGLNAWKVAKDVATMALVLLSIGLVLWTRTYRKTPYMPFVGLSAAYLALHLILYFTNKETSIEVATLATVYNNRLLWYLIIGMSAVLLAPKDFNFRKVTKLVLVVSTIACLIGLLQYALPKDLMTHFGYSIERGVRPAFFIDDKPDLPRVMSTLRDPNSFGAFLIIPLMLIWQNLWRTQGRDRRTLFLGLFGLHGLNLFLTFSRAAWVGAVISMAVLSWIQHKHVLIKHLRKSWPIIATGLSVVLILGFLLRDQYVIQNIIFHSDETTQAELDSNELHVEFIKSGVGAISEQPLGHGPGTAGIVSIQNGKDVVLTENYFLQIGHEVGVIGLGLFIGILVLVVRKLRLSSELDAILFASFCAYMFMSFIMHLWTNEAVAVQWWLLAGIAIGMTTKLGSSAAGRGKAGRRL